MITETLNIHGYQVNIGHEDYAENPRDWHTSTLCVGPCRDNFGNGVELTNALTLHEAFTHHLRNKGLTERDIIFSHVHLYEHGKVALSSSLECHCCDKNQFGYIYEKRSDIRAEFGVRRISPKLEQKIFERLDSELQLLSHWANGDVYYFDVAGEISGSFYGIDHKESGLISEATATVDYLRRQKLRQHTDKLKQLIKAGVALQYRPVLTF